MFFQNPPYENLVLKPDGNYTSIGPTANAHEWLSKKMNYTYGYIFIPGRLNL